MTGWVSRHGHFYGDDEKLARFVGCTHEQCECGKAHEKHWAMCKHCRHRIDDQRYDAMPFKEWDGSTPLFLCRDDTYFFDEDSIRDYCGVNGKKPEELQLVICEPNVLDTINADEFYSDLLPEDMGVTDVLPEIAAAFEALNKAIRENKQPISRGPGKFKSLIVKATGQAA